MDTGLALPTVVLFLVRMLYEIQPQGHNVGSMRNTLCGVTLNLALAASQHPYKIQAGTRDSALQMNAVYVYFSHSQSVWSMGLLQSRL